MSHLSSSHLRIALKYLNKDDSINVTAGYLNRTGEHPKGGVFKSSLHFPPDYPNNPPKVFFVTKICHPNISDRGGIYLRVLRAIYWQAMPITLFFKGLVEKLIEPDVDDEEQVNENLANLYKSDRIRFEAMAREMTNQYAGRGN
ncbi:PREDICTED: ubiquitin-conjugating enzyme E2 11-like [Camelina sativa]|uniref:Ubiquitin-conjugating enzyme E2 11-like n=1 Tax=Camelina sativa TaxID=90675 RepID=A0ABM0VYZ2_CAMSA|nr:PREDICTED: ubiquitin-conjugating enzyme E2 11-like [Camelina sativa]